MLPPWDDKHVPPLHPIINFLLQPEPSKTPFFFFLLVSRERYGTQPKQSKSKPKDQSTKNLATADKNLDTENLDTATFISCLMLSQNLH